MALHLYTVTHGYSTFILLFALARVVSLSCATTSSPISSSLGRSRGVVWWVGVGVLVHAPVAMEIPPPPGSWDAAVMDSSTLAGRTTQTPERKSAPEGSGSDRLALSFIAPCCFILYFTLSFRAFLSGIHSRTHFQLASSQSHL